MPIVPKLARMAVGHMLEKPIQKGIVKMLGGNPAFMDMDEASKEDYPEDDRNAYKKGGKVKRSSASKRGDGIAQRGKTRGRMV